MRIHLGVLLALGCTMAHAQTIYVTSLATPSEMFRFEITSDDLAATPSWKPEEEFPPLSPRKAVAIARSTLLTLMSDKVKWNLHSIRLRPADIDDKWFYEIELMEPDRQPTVAHPLAGVTVPVLMNGKPAPIYRDRKE